MFNYKIYTILGDLLLVKTNVEVTAGDCIVYDNKTYYVDRVQGDVLFSMTIGDTIAAY